MDAILNNLGQTIQTNPLLAFAAVFAAGVLVSFTPCVYPVIPITLGCIGARSAGNRWKGFSLSLVYVLGMALVYAVLGAFAALSGRLFGQIGSHPFTYFIVANVFLLLGLSSLDVFSLPQWSPSGASKKGNGLLSVLVLGMFSGLIVGPCTAPALAAVLVFVGSKQNIIYGFSLLFVFGYGVGFLLILLGTFTGLLTSFPRSGHWLITIKKIFGWLLIFAAEYLFIKMGGLI
jgi:cytochrome c-type biogenesis protein